MWLRTVSVRWVSSSVGSGTLTVTGAGITQSGAILQAAGAGTASFDAGANTLTLDHADNEFTGRVALTNSGANNVELVNSVALDLADKAGAGALRTLLSGAAGGLLLGGSSTRRHGGQRRYRDLRRPRPPQSRGAELGPEGQSTR